MQISMRIASVAGGTAMQKPRNAPEVVEDARMPKAERGKETVVRCKGRDAAAIRRLEQEDH